MFKPTKATTINEYIDSLPEERKEAIIYLHKFIQGLSPDLKSFFAYNMLGYGSFLYKNYKKEVVKWPLIALANQKNYMSLYVCALEEKEYLAEKYKDKLGKVNVGKSCIRFKKLEDLNLEELTKVIKKALLMPGYGDNN